MVLGLMKILLNLVWGKELSELKAFGLGTWGISILGAKPWKRAGL